MTAPSAPARPRAPAGDLLVELVIRDLRLRYRRSVLGALWSQVTPLVTVAVLAVIFTRVIPLGIEDYPVVLLAGLLPWTWLQGALIGGTESVVAGRDLLRQPRFPAWMLPASAVAAHLVQFVLALPVLLIAVAAFTGRVPGTVVALPLVMLVQLALVSGPVLALAAIHVRYRDTAHLVGVVLLPLFYASPVFYDAAALDRASVIRAVNPMVHILDGYRAVLIRGEWPDLSALAPVLVLSAGLAVAGWHVFDRRRGRFIEEL